MALLHPIFPLLIRRPDLVIDHLGGYLALARQEAADSGGELLVRGVALALAAFLVAIFIGLAGGALMLGVLLDRFSWVLILVPGAVLALIVAALLVARRPLPEKAFAQLQTQLAADGQLLRAAAEPDRDAR